VVAHGVVGVAIKRRPRECSVDDRARLGWGDGASVWETSLRSDRYSKHAGQLPEYRQSRQLLRYSRLTPSPWVIHR
jgi:hypothetical protein